MCNDCPDAEFDEDELEFLAEYELIEDDDDEPKLEILPQIDALYSEHSDECPCCGQVDDDLSVDTWFLYKVNNETLLNEIWLTYKHCLMCGTIWN